MTIWRALMEGIGWRVGKEIAEDAIDSVKKKIVGPDEDAPPEEAPAARAKRLALEAKAAAKRAEEARKVAVKRAADDAKAVDRELETLKKQIAREKK